MPDFEGVLRRVDLGMGAWVLETAGQRYQLAGAVPPGLEGKRVRVTGRPSARVGFAMTGDPTLEIGEIAAVERG
jgi:hypothetical protein